jgi:hypothetical protein
VEFAFANETDIANFYCRIKFPWAWFPQGVPVGRVLDRELLTESVVVSHQGNDVSMMEGTVGGERLRVNLYARHNVLLGISSENSVIDSSLCNRRNAIAGEAPAWDKLGPYISAIQSMVVAMSDKIEVASVTGTARLLALSDLVALVSWSNPSTSSK